MIRLGLLAVILSVLVASPVVVPAAGVEIVAAVSLPQQEETPEAPEIGPYPGEQEPDCE